MMPPDLHENLAAYIEDIVWELDIGYMEAALVLAQRYDIEEDVIGTMVKDNQNLMAKIRADAEALHYVKKEHRLEDI